LRDMKINIFPPSINRSIGKYTVENGAIRIGLLSIKGIGYNVVSDIIQERRKGSFQSLFDFCLRISSKTINRGVMETLILAGTFDILHSNRASLLASLDQAMEQGDLFREFKDQPQLFQDKIDLDVG